MPGAQNVVSSGECDDYKGWLHFQVQNTTHGLVQELRRYLMTELPTMAINDVTIYRNQGLLSEEVLAQRLGLIPLRCSDIEKMDYISPEDLADRKYNSLNVAQFRLKIRCPPHQARDIMAQDLEYQALSLSLESTGEVEYPQVEYPQVEPVKYGVGSVTDSLVVTRLVSKNDDPADLEVICYATKGLGKDHAKFKPVSVVVPQLERDLGQGRGDFRFKIRTVGQYKTMELMIIIRNWFKQH